MNDAKYIGLDVHQTTISATVFDNMGDLSPFSQRVLGSRIIRLLRRPMRNTSHR